MHLIKRANHAYGLLKKMTDFPTALRVLKEDRQLTIEELAGAADIDSRTINRYLKSPRRIKYENICKLCFALHIEPELVDQFFALAGYPFLMDEKQMIYRTLIMEKSDLTLFQLDEELMLNGMQEYCLAA